MLSQHPSSLTFSILRNPLSSVSLQFLTLTLRWSSPPRDESLADACHPGSEQEEMGCRGSRKASSGWGHGTNVTSAREEEEEGRGAREGRCRHEQGSEGSQGRAPAWAALPGDHQPPENPARHPKGNSGVGEAQGPCFWSLPELFMTRYLVCQKKKKFYSIRKKNFGWIVWIIKAQSSSFQGLLNLDSFTVL